MAGLGACVSQARMESHAKAVTAGQTGCTEDQIQVNFHNDKKGMEHYWTWQAFCRGTAYICTQDQCTEVPGSGPQVAPGAPPPAGPPVGPPGPVAAPPPAQPPPADPASLGCYYDTQCKGERICRDHVCVDP